MTANLWIGIWKLKGLLEPSLTHPPLPMQSVMILWGVVWICHRMPLSLTWIPNLFPFLIVGLFPCQA